MQPGFKLGLVENRRVGLIAVEEHDGDTAFFLHDLPPAGHLVGHEFAAAVDMTEHAVALEMVGDIRALAHHRGRIDDVGGGKHILLGHFIQIARRIVQAPGADIAVCNAVDDILFHGLEVKAKIRPAGDALPVDTVLLGRGAEGGRAVVDMLLDLALELQEHLSGFTPAARNDHGRHVVEQVETVERSGVAVVHQDALVKQPRVFDRDFLQLKEFIPVEFLAEEFLHTVDVVLDLAAAVSDPVLSGLGVRIVEQAVLHEDRDIQLARQAFVPFKQLKAAVGGAEQECRTRHALHGGRLIVGVVGHLVRHADAQAGVRTDIVGITQLALRGCDKTGRVMARGYTGRVVFRIQDRYVERGAQLLRKDRGGPADRLALGLCVPGKKV